MRQVTLKNLSPISKKFQTSCSTDFINLCKQHNINIKIDISKCFNHCLKILKMKKYLIYSDYITVGFENDTDTRLITFKDHGISYNFS